VEPLVCFYHDGYLRVNADPYDPQNTANSFAHITNFHVAVKHPDYDPVKDRVGDMDVRWNFAEFQNYINTLREDSTAGQELMHRMKVQMKIILSKVMDKMKTALSPQEGCFALLGVDFILDEDEQLWLLEFTKNPALRSNTPYLAKLHGGLVHDIVHIALEVQHQRDQARSLSTFKPATNETSVDDSQDKQEVAQPVDMSQIGSETGFERIGPL